MGKLSYETNVKIEMDDRALAHVQSVISAKLRRGESFFFSWKDDVSVGGGRNSVWIHPRASLHFKFFGGRMPAINATWLRALAQTANSPRGLYLVPEPADIPVSEEPVRTIPVMMAPAG